MANILSASYYTTSSRAANTVYQNTTGYPMWVIIYGGAGVTGVIGSSNPPTFVQWNEQCNSNGAFSVASTIMIFVPNNWYYKFTNQAQTGSYFAEYKILTNVLTGYNTDLSASRALNTNYTNTGTTGMIVLAIVDSGGAGVTMDGYSDGSHVYTAQGGTIGFGNNALTLQTIPLFVPAGKTYKVNATSGSITQWIEIDIGADFSESAEQNTALAVGASAIQNTSGSAWFVERPVQDSSTSDGDIQLISDSSSTPTAVRSAFSVRYTLQTVYSVVMPNDYVKIAKTGSGTYSDPGSSRIYGLGGPVVLPKDILQFANP